ncbi:MAG: acetoin dehydrogenase [Rickettsiales bacterium]|nr:acetoin dehydrogenase [Rickettsiales bacterium]|tara:strand:- start:796 stop:1746 length:951 start_codon:yes stop_codon:yes gene_type:complete
MKLKKFNFEDAFYLFKKIRSTEEKIIEIYESDVIKSPVHLSLGQESIAVGVALASEKKKDVIFSNYRSHAHFIAHGGNYKKMWAELFGKETGLSSGKAGSMHLGDVQANFIFTSAIVGSAISEAVGYALAIKLKKLKSKVICYHGEGAMDQGTFWESLNFSALKELPILYVCENNGLAIYSEQKKRMKVLDLCKKVESFGVHTIRVKNNSTENIFKCALKALKKIEKNSQPIFLEVNTYREVDHVGIYEDFKLGFRKKNKQKLLKSFNELNFLKKKTKNFLQIEKKINKEIVQALNYSYKSNFPKIKYVELNVTKE